MKRSTTMAVACTAAIVCFSGISIAGPGGHNRMIKGPDGQNRGATAAPQTEKETKGDGATGTASQSDAVDTADGKSRRGRHRDQNARDRDSQK